jgi:tetratricopeptide (TPR) repeat protein
MARRRINTRFIGIIFTVLVSIVAVLVVLKKFVLHERPEPYIAAGRMYAEKGQWEQAVGNFSKAASLTHNDSALLVELGVAQLHMASVDSNYRTAAAQSWRGAVEIDPDNKDAWQRLLEVYSQDLHQLEVQPKNDRNRETLVRYYGLVWETATQVNRLIPDDLKVKAILQTLVIRQWLFDLPIPNRGTDDGTDEEKVNKAIADLGLLEQRDPENTEIPFWIARAKIHQAENAQAASQNSDAAALLKDAASAFDAPILAQPKALVLMYMNQTQILSHLMMIDNDPDNRKKYADQIHQSLDAAQAMVKPDDPQYMGVKLQWAYNLSKTDPGRAEAVYNDLRTRFPNEYAPKISYAAMLMKDRSRREDALKVLSDIPDAPPIAMEPVRRQQLQHEITDVQFIRTDIRIDEYIDTPPGSDKDKLGADVTKSLGSLADQYGNDWRYLKLQGKYQLTTKHIREAVQSFDNALNQIASQSLPQDSELLQLAADAYQSADQTGRAIEILKQAMADPAVNARLTPHMALAQLYLNNKDPINAKTEIDYLTRRFPNSAEVVKMEIQTMDPVADHAKVLDKYNSLPESNPELIAEKAQVAHQIGDDDDAIRLLKLLLAAKPDDVGTAVSLVELQLATGHKDEANKTLVDALQKNPIDPTLNVLSRKMNGASDAEMHDIIVAAITKNNPDPYIRELRFADLAAKENKPDEQLDHLKKAEAIKSTGVEVQQQLFLFYVNTRQFDLAQTYIPKLVQADADQAQGLLFKLKLALAKRDVPGALAVGQQLTTQFPEFANSWEGQGEALQMAGQPDAAAEKYLTALQKQATNVKALRNLIAVSYQMKKYDDAKRYIDEARQKFPHEQAYRDLEVQHELLHGDPEKVLPELRDSMKNDPDNQRNYGVTVDALLRLAATKTTAGETTEANNYIDQARDVLQQAVKRWPDSFEFSSTLATVYTGSGDLPSGEATLKALADRPQWKDSPAPLIALAQIYLQAGKASMAEQPLRDAMTKAKGQNIPELQLRLAQVLGEQGKYDDALKVLETNRNLTAILKERLDLMISAKRGADAEAEITSVINANPNNPQLKDLLIFVLFGQQKLDQVKALATQMIAADPNDMPAYFYRGMAELMQSTPDPTAALADLGKFREQNPENVEAAMAVADASVMNNDREGGITVLEDQMRITPDNKALRLKLVDFYQQIKPPRWIDAEQILTDSLAQPQFKNDADFLRSAALMWSAREDGDKAITSIRAAMAQVPDKSVLVHDYLDILLAAKNYSLLITEAGPLLANGNGPWWAYNDKARAEAQSGDTTNATDDFRKALDAAGAERGHGVATKVANDIVTDMSVDKAVEMVGPLTKNSLKWKLVSIPLYNRKGDQASAIANAESAMASFSSLTPQEQDELLTLTGSLYLAANPPMVDKAIPIYKQMLDRHPDDFVSLNNIACLLAEMANPRQPEEGLKYSQRAYDDLQKANRVEPRVYDTQGWVLILCGRTDDGISVLHDIIDKADFPEAHYHLAVAYLKKNQPENAQRELDAAADLYDKALANKQAVDPTLKEKIVDARNQANQMNQAKPQAQAAP